MDIKRKKGSASDEVDPVVDSVVKAKNFVTANRMLIVACTAAVVVIVGGWFILNWVKETNIRKAQEVFGVGILDYNADRLDLALGAFTQVANSHRNTPMGTMSAFMMGSIYLQQGDAGQAATWFETAANGKEAGFVRGQALEGLAAAHEEKGNNAEAIRYLERALRDRSVSHRHSAIRWRLALLNKDNNASAAGVYCRELIADTLATAYHQRAENLLAVINMGK